jgi:hypothetical protein
MDRTPVSDLNDSPERKPYEPPQLTDLGSVDELTQGMTGGPGDQTFLSGAFEP